MHRAVRTPSENECPGSAGIRSYPKNRLPVPLSRSFAALAVTIGLAASPAAASAPSAPVADPSDALIDAVRTLASERQGVTAFHRDVASQQRAPGHDASLDVHAGLLRDGDLVVAVRVYSQVANGTAAFPEDLAKAQAAADKNQPSDDYLLPLREDTLSDYRIAGATCDRCAPGELALAFTSLKRDASHGDGTVVIDPTTHHIVRVDFVPSGLPKYVDRASVTVTFGQVLPGLWDVVEMRQHYQGHVYLIRGDADITTSLTNYRRFASRDEGLKALASGV
jgi:hypothetical protein